MCCLFRTGGCSESENKWGKNQFQNWDHSPASLGRPDNRAVLGPALMWINSWPLPWKGRLWSIPLPQEVTRSHCGTKQVPTQHPQPHLHLLFCCLRNPPGAVQGQRWVFVNSGTHKPSPVWMWAAVQPRLYHTMEKHPPTGRIEFTIPIFPSSSIPLRSAPEWHFSVASPAFLWFWPQTSCSPEHLVVQNKGEFVSNNFHVPCWSEKASEAEGRRFKELPPPQMLSHVLHCPLLLQEVVCQSCCK